VHFTYKEALRRGLDLDSNAVWKPFLGRLQAESDFSLSYDVSIRLIAEAVRLSGDPDFGLSVGFQRPIPAYGHLLPALMCCKTYGHAVEVATRYHYVLGSLVETKLQRLASGDLALVFHPRYPVGWVKRFLMQKAISHTLVQARFFYPEPGACKHICFDFPGSVPAHLEDMFDCPVMFQQPQNCIVLSGGVVSKPIPTADTYSLNVAIAALEKEMTRYRSSRTLLQKVQWLCLTDLPQSPTAQSVAAKIGVSERTLRRELSRVGTSFRETLQTLRKQRATELLANTEMPLVDVAKSLGFGNAKTLHVNVLDWTGSTPAQIRKNQSTANRDTIAPDI
jgi:AraC-like DNA-binding protein